MNQQRNYRENDRDETRRDQRDRPDRLISQKNTIETYERDTREFRENKH